jgi:hypothetical protein
MQQVAALVPEFKKLHLNVTVGWVDAREERGLRHKLGSECSADCFLRVVRRYELPTTIKAETEVGSRRKKIKKN